MNTPRRIVGLVVAVLAGAVATLAFAAPASAHYATVAGQAVCLSDSGQWQVTWTVSSHKTGLAGNLTTVALTPASSTVTAIATGAVLPANPGTIVGVQLVPGTATSASLAVGVHWPDGFNESAGKPTTVTFSGSCVEDQPKPNASFTSACDGTVTVDLTNDAAATKAAAFTVSGAGGFVRNVTVAKGGEAKVAVPASAASSISVTVGKLTVAQSTWSEPGDCAPMAVSSKADCTSLTITLDNPVGNRALDATITSGGASQTVTVPAGESKDVSLPATAGTTATVSFGAAAVQAAQIKAAAAAPPVTITWQQPAACVTTPPPALPTTGAKVGPLVAAGTALLALGAGVILVLFRRRRALESRTF